MHHADAMYCVGVHEHGMLLLRIDPSTAPWHFSAEAKIDQCECTL